MTWAYYNEWEPYCAQWLRNLIAAGHTPAGEVDERDIREVAGDDVKGFAQCHFFAGLGGWAYAARLAGIPDDEPIWTGSCPCQPFSSAARGRVSADDLWPEWRRLILSARPGVLFGEQVAHAGRWFDGLCNDLEAVDYQIGAAVLPACGVGHDHARPRIFYVGYANGHGKPSLCIDGKMAGVSERGGDARELAPEDGIPARMGKLRAYGNAIVPQVAAEFMVAARAA